MNEYAVFIVPGFDDITIGKLYELDGGYDFIDDVNDIRTFVYYCDSNTTVNYCPPMGNLT